MWEVSGTSRCSLPRIQSEPGGLTFPYSRPMSGLMYGTDLMLPVELVSRSPGQGARVFARRRPSGVGTIVFQPAGPVGDPLRRPQERVTGGQGVTRRTGWCESYAARRS